MKFTTFLSRLHRRFVRKISANHLLLGCGIILLIFGFLLFVIKPLFGIGQPLVNKTPPFTLKNDNGRTNILLMGIGGAGHDGPNLSDTMIVVSATSSGQITMISIPRDIYMDSLQGKINSAYQAGLDQSVGMILAEQAAGEITGLPIQYGVVVDFSVFENVIDILGGIEVNVPALLDDYQYPVDGKETGTCGFSPEDVTTKSASIVDDQSALDAFPCRYEHLHFDVGLQHMDGKTALKYVRSRHAEGDEGSDFARSRRQQLVIKAVKDKVLAANNLLNPLKYIDVLNQFKSHVVTDFDLSRPDQLIKLGLNYRNSTIKNIFLDLALLYNPPIDQRGWILLPIGGNWDEVHKYIQSQL